MTLYKMALNNIKHNFKNYWAFFLSSSFSVFILYLFTSIIYSKNIQDMLGSMKKFMIIFQIGLSLCLAFSAFFILYSNSFFIKSRKKEFATYMLLGMSKKQTVILNIFENFIIMLISLFTGIITGFITNKFFIMLLLFMMKTTGNVPFILSIKALKYCITVFGIIFLLMSLHSITLMYKNNLIDLFNASKKVEKGLKASFLTLIIGILGICCLAYGYYNSIKKLGDNFSLAPMVVLVVSVGTILLFTSLVSFFIYINKKNERKLFSGTRLISNSQLYYRYRGNVGTLSVIAISTTVALCAVLTCCGVYFQAVNNSRNMRPMSIEYINGNSDTDKTFQSILTAHNEVSIKSKDNLEFLQVNSKNPLYKDDEDYYIVSESKFNKINSDENIKRNINLKSDNNCYYVQIAGYAMDPKIALNKRFIFKAGSNNYNLNIQGTDTKAFLALEHFRDTIVVKDTVYNKIKSDENNNIAQKVTGYMLNNDFFAKSFVKDLNAKIPKDNQLLTFYDHYSDAVKLLGIMAFVGLFIGVLFITATGSLIYFKMSTEAREDKDKFITLKKIGVSTAEIKKAVSKELIILFGAPLLAAAANTYAASFALSKLIDLTLTREYILIILIYAALYSIYYKITLNSYVNTVNN